MAHRYQIIERIAAGGTAAVWRAVDTSTNQPVAIKRLHGDHAEDDEARARLGFEVEVGTRLTHPAIVAVLDQGEDESVPYLVMELVTGETLADLLRRVGPLPLERATAIAVEVAEALQYAHDQGVLHRDVKPANILIEHATGRVRLTDFGTAAPVQADTRTTQEGIVIGTVDYLPPERALGAVGTAASDVYALGCVLYEMVTGRVPHRGDTPLAVAMAHQMDEPEPPSRFVAIPPAVERVILTAMAKGPERRYPSAAAFASALEAAVLGVIEEPTIALPTVGRRRRFPVWMRRPVVAVAAASVALGAASTAAVLHFIR